VATAFGAWTIPLTQRDEVHELEFRPAGVAAGRTHGLIDGWGTGEAPLEASVYEVPFILTGTPSEIHTARLALQAGVVGGRKRLTFTPDGSVSGAPALFCEARPARVREMILRRSPLIVRYTLRFLLPNPARLQALGEADVETYAVGSNGVQVAENVFGESWLERWFGVYTNPTTLTINNPGSLRCPLIIRITAGAAGGYDEPTVSNAATGQSVQVLRTAAGSSSVLQINTELDAGGVRESEDGGASLVDLGYGDATTNAWPDTEVPDDQGPVLELARGENVITVSGVPNGTIGFLWQPWWLL
jgi:hypothetical protein